jgi:transposase
MARKYYTTNFKARVALEALKEDATVPQLAQKHGVHPTQINDWKSNLILGAECVFSKDKKVDNGNEKLLAELERKIGQLTIENDFLKKNLAKYHK